MVNIYIRLWYFIIWYFIQFFEYTSIAICIATYNIHIAICVLKTLLVIYADIYFLLSYIAHYIANI